MRATLSEAHEPRDAQWDAYTQKRGGRFTTRKSFNRATAAEREAELHKTGVTELEIEEAKKRLRERGRGYLFPQRVGTGSDYGRAMNDLHHAHERALKASGIEPRFRIYDLRHTYGTRAIEAGMNPLTLAKLMGHADLKTTQRYVHLSKQHLGEAQKRMEDFRAVLEIADAEQRAAHRSGATTETGQWKN
jgi:integrase